MNTKKSRTVWFGATLIACAAVLLVVITPEVNAQEAKSQSRQYMDLLQAVFNFVEQNYVDEVDPQVLYEGAMKGMMESLGDPYTAYMDTAQMRSLNDTTVGNFGGVGLSISKPIVSTAEKPAYVEVASPVEDTPGWNAGIQPGDLIISINGVPTPDITMDEVLEMLRGNIGETVDLVIRRGKNLEFPVTLTRALIEVQTVKYGMIENNIAYLRIIEFTPQTAEKVQQALDYFIAQKFTGLIIDLRNNPGGLLNSVADVADKFIDKGSIVTTKSRIEYQNSVFSASPSKTTMPKDIPIVVLINRGSASASEILAGALKDDHLAYLVGENTYGKGSVQQVVPLRNGDGIKITMARYYTPSDANIDKTGIPPDREVLFPQLTETEEKALNELFNEQVIAAYVENHADMSEADINVYAKELQKNYPLELRVLKKLISQEVHRTQIAPLVDMEYDIQLQEAVSIIRTEDFIELMKNTKTIKELQQQSKE